MFTPSATAEIRLSGAPMACSRHRGTESALPHALRVKRKTAEICPFPIARTTQDSRCFPLSHVRELKRRSVTFLRTHADRIQPDIASGTQMHPDADVV
jgi:hypothetical protein